MPRAALLGGFAAAVLLATALAPSASAHAATEPLSVETHALSDEASGVDAFYYADGYDLYNTYVREAYHAPSDETGVIWRFDIYGGFGPVSTSSELHVEMGVGGMGDDAPSARITTTDDRNWTSETATVVFQDTSGDAQPPFPGYTHILQVFVPYEALDLQAGGTLEEPWMRSYADSDPVDDAPGGYYVPGTGGTPEAPDGGGSERLADALDLEGPEGYVDVGTETDGTLVHVNVTSNLESTGQHVQLEVPDAAGWTTELQGEPEVSLDPEGSTTFTVNATPDGAVDPLPLRVVTDLGGLETLSVGAEDAGLSPADADHGVSVAGGGGDGGGEEQGQGVPVGVEVVLAALGVAALGVRRE